MSSPLSGAVPSSGATSPCTRIAGGAPGTRWRSEAPAFTARESRSSMEVGAASMDRVRIGSVRPDLKPLESPFGRRCSPEGSPENHPNWGMGSPAQRRCVSGNPHAPPNRQLRKENHPHVQADPAAPRREQRAGLHPDRASCRDHHHRHPARDRRPVVPRVPRSRGQERRARPTSGRRHPPSRRSSPTTARTRA